MMNKTNRVIKVFFLFFLMGVMTNCSDDQGPKSEGFSYSGKNSSENYAASADDAIQLEEEIEMEPQRLDENIQKQKPRIIRDGTMNFEVNDAHQAKTRVDSIISQYDAYYEQDNYHSSSYNNTYTLKVRIPVENFDSLMIALEQGAGKLLNKSVSSKDVTEEYVDLNIRLKNSLAYLEQYKQILKKAKTIKEILEVQEKIRRLEADIDSKKGRIAYLDSKADFSTLQIELTERITRVTKMPSFTRRIGNAFKGGFELFQNLLIGVIHLWPIILIIGLIIFFRRRIFSVFRRKKN